MWASAWTQVYMLWWFYNLTKVLQFPFFKYNFICILLYLINDVVRIKRPRIKPPTFNTDHFKIWAITGKKKALSRVDSIFVNCLRFIKHPGRSLEIKLLPFRLYSHQVCHREISLGLSSISVRVILVIWIFL